MNECELTEVSLLISKHSTNLGCNTILDMLCYCFFGPGTNSCCETSSAVQAVPYFDDIQKATLLQHYIVLYFHIVDFVTRTHQFHCDI